MNGGWYLCAVVEEKLGSHLARTNRRDFLADGEIQVVHCINRCVRRAYLCGQDPLTGADYEHRRGFIRQRMEFLAGILGDGVVGYPVMSNHFHMARRRATHP